MSLYRLLVVFIALSCYVNVSAKASSLQVEVNCDLADANLSSQKAESLDLCQKACQSDAACAAFVFVSGWKRCFFKASSAKKRTIRFYSGHYLRAHDGKPAKVLKAAYDQDHSGKDLKREVVSTHEECVQKCAKLEACHAFTFIEGYDVCWLKAAGGQLLPKVFYCGISQAEAK